MTTLKIVGYGQSDVGKKREKNEDSFVISEDLGLYMVADGMGGHLGGGTASRIAVETVPQVLRTYRGNTEDKSDPVEQLKAAIKQASAKIFEAAERDANLKGMGTTSVVLLVRDDKIYIAHVGDSRAYLIRNKEVRQLTNDHSLVGEQLRAGLITEGELKHHKFKNIITRSVGFQSDVEVDVLIHDPQPGDRFFLCSDGLSNMVENADILKMVSKNNPKGACQKLIALANKKGGDDNITVVIASVEPV